MAVYSPSDIAGLLKVKESTLRKYSLLLEECGYTFDRNDQNQRWYNDKDVIAFQKLIAFKQNGDMNLKTCAEAVYLWSKGGSVTEVQTATYNAKDRHDVVITTEEVNELKELVVKQQQFITDLGKRLEESFTKQEQRDKYLLQKIEDLTTQVETQREEQQLLLTPPSEEKQSFFNRFFKK